MMKRKHGARNDPNRWLLVLGILAGVTLLTVIMAILSHAGSTPSATPPTVAPAPTSTDPLYIGDHPQKTISGAAVRNHIAHFTILTPADLPGTFHYIAGAPGVAIMSPQFWEAVALLDEKRTIDRGLTEVQQTVLRTTTPDAQIRAAQEVPEAAAAPGDVFGPHHEFRPPNALPGVRYLKHITVRNGYWFGMYDAVFTSDKYANYVGVVVNLSSQNDPIFGVADLNRLVRLILQREAAHP